MSDRFESKFTVIVPTVGAGLGLQEQLPDKDARDVLRALYLGLGPSVEVYQNGERLVYNPKGNDMGHHDEEGEPPIPPFTREPSDRTDV